jgi:hypothetical protein
MTGMTPATPSARDCLPSHLGTVPEPRSSRPAPGAAARIIQAMREHPCWSAFWDKQAGVWRVAEDDPDSGLYAESSDPDTVIGYIQAHS